MLFADRIDAAERLAKALQAYRGRHPLILAIPRGALPMGKLLAERLGGELDVVLVRKLRSPFSPEYAIGSIDETGWVYLAPHAHSTGRDGSLHRGRKAAPAGGAARTPRALHARPRPRSIRPGGWPSWSTTAWPPGPR